MTALAMIGSLFTRQPAVAAGNAAAAAMTAMKKNDQTAYTNSMTEYREKLTKAHQENQSDVEQYKLILENKKISMTERLANLRAHAVRRGDQAILNALDAGSDPLVQILARERAGEIISPRLEKAAFLQSFLKRPENETATVADADKAYAVFKQGSKAPSAETKSKQEAEAIDEITAAHSGDPTWTRAKSIADFKATTAAPPRMTGNQAVKEKHVENQITEQLDVIDSTMGVLQQYRMAAGAAGYVTRGAEIVGNISGTDLGTDREQFRRDIEFLRMMFPRIMASGGRPLAADQKRVDAIIGGLSMGDTTANTMRSLEELQKIYLRRLQEQQDILAPGGTTPPNARPPGTTAPPSSPGGAVDWGSFPEAR